MPEPQTPRTDTQASLTAARNQTRRAVHQLAIDSGAQLIIRPMFQGSAEPTTRDVEPLFGARAARDIELSARTSAREYIRCAREAGQSWEQIGHALGLAPEPGPAGMTVAEAAYTYAAGSPNTPTAMRYGRSFRWTCRSCDQLIIDHGHIAGPAEDERGHAERCPRLTATIAAWNAEWEAEL